ncbi:MAG: penicillin-binding protein 2 [Armatimonadetes bacterium]|nr:penicillin-binding protein 2 [Armatimonadota bacterium]
MPPFSQVIKRRTEGLFLIFFIAYALIAMRLAYVQVVQHNWYAQKAKKWHSTEIPLIARRGPILTRDGRPLAVTVQCANVFIRPRNLKPEEREKALQGMARALGKPVEELRPKIESDKKFVYLARRIEMPAVQKIKEMDLPGVGIEEGQMKRVYPNNSLASNLIGFTDIDGHGREGIEKTYDKSLTGRDGLAVAQVDARRKVIADTQIVQAPARDGKPMRLSIDFGLQSAAETELDEMAKLYKPAGATCTVMDVHTGEVLAMATYPRFDPNQPGKFDADHRRNRPVTDTYEPGSTLKTVTIASALDHGTINLNSTYSCAGREKIGKKAIRCVIHAPFKKGHGTVDPKLLIEHSCNIATAKIGLQMQEHKLKEYMRRFGLAEKTGIELSGEEKGIFPEANKKWANMRTANVAFGQGISVTPIQLLTAYSAVANGGKLVQPTILKRTRPVKARQIITPQAAAETRDLLQACVANGTGKPAKIRGYRVGGKTGSAQKVTPGIGYKGRKFIASFASVVPIQKPRIAILVTVDEPKGTHWGAVAAAPVVREVARQAVIELGIPPDNVNDPVDGSEPKTWKKDTTR